MKIMEPQYCRMCGPTTNKRGRSHITPAFLWREIKNRSGPLIELSRNGAHKYKNSKDGHKDHKIMCLKCESETNWIDSFAHMAFSKKSYHIHTIYSKFQRRAGYFKHCDALMMKRFIAFTVLKAHWSQIDFYINFQLELDAEQRLLPFTKPSIPAESGLLFYLFRREATQKDLPESPTVHNGRIDSARMRVLDQNGFLILYHFLEFTAFLFISDDCKSVFSEQFSIQNDSQIIILRSPILNEKLDEIAFQFVADRLRSEIYSTNA